MAERETLAILFYLRKDKARTEKQIPIYMRITVNRKRAEMALHRYIDPDKWDDKARTVRGTKKEIRLLNEFFDLHRSKVYKAQQELLEEGKHVSAKSLRNRVQGKKEEMSTFIEVFEFHNKRILEQVPDEYSQATYTRYCTTLDHLKAFLKYKYKTDDIQLTQLNHEFISSFDHYFRTEKKCNNNTTVKYIKNIRKIANLAVKNDWLRKDPFIRYAGKTKVIDREFLAQDELDAIINLDLKVRRLDLVRDLFVFACYTGLSYSDTIALTLDNIQMDVDGDNWIKIKRIKTDTKSDIPVLSPTQKIIDKYSDDPSAEITGRLFPGLSNQKTNAYLKEIANLAGISKNLTFHIARHTFATTVTLASGTVSLESVSEMLGHKSIRTTQHYAKIVDKKVKNDMMKLESEISRKNKKALNTKRS